MWGQKEILGTQQMYRVPRIPEDAHYIFGESWALLKDIGEDNLKIDESIIFMGRKVRYYEGINSL